MSDPAQRLEENFRRRVVAGELPTLASQPSAGPDPLSGPALVALFESQLISRRLDLAARRFSKEKKAYYSIGSSGHEGNAAFGRRFGLTDLAFLHYRSGAFFAERARRRPGSTPIWDMALSFVASADDPCSGGRHKVLGSAALGVPPQTSTIASHLPKAVGAAHGAALARTQKRADPDSPANSVVIASFGDASANHSTAQGAINAALWAAYQSAPMPIIFLCEDNGIGISTPTPQGWIAANFANRPGLAYLPCDGRDLRDVWRASGEAERIARLARRPVFVHMRAVRLMGHAGSDMETTYRPPAAIAAAENEDPLLYSAGLAMTLAGMSAQDVLALDDQIAARVDRAMREATGRDKLTTAQDVKAPVTPDKDGPWRRSRSPSVADPARREAAFAKEARALNEPQHMSRLISLALADEMARDERMVVLGEDVGAKGGVYGATTRLRDKFGRARVLDTLLDEQTILGTAIGLAHQGYLAVPEIQFLAYVHNAEDQIRGEAATLSFFSNGRFANPMVVRIAGLGYQKGFGGHFHNDNALAVFRDIPGIVLATPSNGADAVRMLRGCVRLAQEEGRVVVFLEPIALYGTKDLYEDGDGALTATYPEPSETIGLGEVGRFGEGDDIAIVSYANGAYLSRRAARILSDSHGVSARVVDLRWLAPLPVEAMLDAVGEARTVLIVDECRRTGGPSEAVMTALVERDFARPFARIAAEDTFIPLGPAATAPLPSETDIIDAALALIGRDAPAAAEAAE